MYSFERRDVRRPPSLYDPLGEVSASTRSVEVEVRLKHEPRMRLRLDADIPAYGGTAQLEKIELAGNPQVPRHLEHVVEDRLKAEKGVVELYRRGLSLYYVQRVFSAGLLGAPERRRLVPTRWSITAVDSIIGRFLLKALRDRPSVTRAELYFHEYLGNKYYIILIPSDAWRMMMFEVWLPNSVWLRGVGEPITFAVHEDYDGRPSHVDGGYYAMRTSILEHLARAGRKAAVLAVRVITPAYIAPVGSWQIRESVKIALEKKPIASGDLAEVLEVLRRREPCARRLPLESCWLIRRSRDTRLDEYLES